MALNFPINEPPTHNNENSISSLELLTIQSTPSILSFANLFFIYSNNTSSYVSFKNMTDEKQFCIINSIIKFINHKIDYFDHFSISSSHLYGLSNKIEFEFPIERASTFKIEKSFFMENPFLSCKKFNTLIINECKYNFKLHFESCKFLEINDHIGDICINNSLFMKFHEKNTKFQFNENIIFSGKLIKKYIFSRLKITQTMIIHNLDYFLTFYACQFEVGVELIVFKQSENRYINITSSLRNDANLAFFVTNLDIFDGEVRCYIPNGPMKIML